MLKDHIEDLLKRFGNKNLGDTIFRVGHDLERKLGKDDRFMGIVRLAQEVGSPSSSHSQSHGHGLSLP